jgi:16S rRNA (cytosine967-C5)-methyltransferase
MRLSAEGIGVTPCGEAGLMLDRPLPVERLPGFAEGLVSVQDPTAQMAAALLDPAPGSRVLDACAAPGGKAAHLLERADLDLLGLDLKPSRCRRVAENLARLGLHASLKAADCARLDTWWDGRPFDAVLADVPCTASGVVRRNPDAKWLRRETDIASFAMTQARILDALWQVVQPGGRLLYATCSVFPEENTGQISRFLATRPDARRAHEEQILPTADHDGFFYCRLEKRT